MALCVAALSGMALALAVRDHYGKGSEEFAGVLGLLAVVTMLAGSYWHWSVGYSGFLPAKQRYFRWRVVCPLALQLGCAGFECVLIMNGVAAAAGLCPLLLFAPSVAGVGNLVLVTRKCDAQK